MRIKFLSALFGFLAATQAFAVEFHHEDSYLLGPGDSVQSQIAVAANKAVIKGLVADDLFLFANDAEVPGTLDNDGWFAANSLRISGSVRDHLRILANTATVSGSVSNSLMAAGNSLQLTRQSHIAGSVNAIEGNAILEGYIGGSARLMAEQVTLSGEIHGDVRIYANDIVVMPGTVIGGDLTYTSDKELVLDQKVALKGKLTRKYIDKTSPQLPEVSPAEIILVQFYLFIAALMVGIPFAGLLPRLTGHAVRLIRHSGLKCALVGMVSFCMFPMVSTLVLVTLVGIPLGVALMSVFMLLLYLSKIVTAIALGGVLMRWRGPQPFGRVMLALSLGLVLLYTVATLPIVGVAAWFGVTFLGMGGLVLGAFQTQAAGEAPAGPKP